MPAQDQLEIISADGGIEFYDLDPARGITNIGSHPDNDIILDSPGVAPFHAVLDHRQKPYQLLVLSDEGQTALSGRLLLPNVASSLTNWDNVQFDGYTLILVEGEGPVVRPGAPAAAPTVPPPTAAMPPGPPGHRTEPRARTITPPSGSPVTGRLPARPMLIAPPPTRPESPPRHGGPDAGPATTPSPAAARRGSLVALPPDHLDEFIVTELSTQEWTVDVEQTATFQLTIINGGDIVAMFGISLEGLDENWVTISQPYVNLNEGERATITIALSAPRLPGSRAGAHHFAIVVTSPNYPGRYSQRGGTLVINPYYEFSVGELDPKQQTISWFKRSGQVTAFIINKGNSDTLFRLDGADEERACSFEFQVPGETIGLARQAELRLPSEESISIPIRITPHSRRLIGLRRHSYAFTITTTMLEGQQTPRSQLGQLRSKPLIGPWLLALLALLLLILIVYIFRPTINSFTADPQIVRAGEEVTLRWSASPFANLRIGNGVGPVEGATGETIIAPAGAGAVVYELKAENWLSAFSATWFTDMRQVSVQVEPVRPIIRVFSSDKEAILTGEEVTLSWEVIDADELILQTNGNPETILSTEHTSQRIVAPPGETTYTLVARNNYGQVSNNLTVRVTVPTATPVPTPFVKKFLANPSIIIAGTPVLVEWDVEGADTVSVLPIGSNMPPVQTISQSPQQNTTYVLNAAKGSSAIQPIAVQVFVTPPPTSTPEPNAPEIVFFEADPTELIQGKAETSEDEKEVTLTWLVRGIVTNVELNGGPDIGIFSNLSPEGSLPVSVIKNTVFVLTAFNQDKTSSKTTQVEILEATPTATTPPPSATPLPLAVIREFRISDPGEPQVRFVDESGDTRRYEVQQNTNAVFRWEVDGATKITLTEPGSSQDVGAVGQSTKKISDSGIKTFTLIAENGEGKRVQRNIEVQVVTQPPPNPPFNVIGAEKPADQEIELRWEWDFTPSRSDIVGFRIYRANVPGSDFSRVADEGDLPREARDYVDDSVNETCGKAYYVVAVYLDLEGVPRESPVSTNSWYSTPCPP